MSRHAASAALMLLFCAATAQARPSRNHSRQQREAQAAAAQEQAPAAPTPPAEPAAAAQPDVAADANVQADLQAQQGLLGDTPPPSTYDRLVGSSSDSNYTSENQTMVGQLLRTLAALVGVLALIFFGAKLLIPRVNRGKFNRSSSLEVLERLNLDGRNTLVVVGTKKGGRILLGCSEHGVTLLERTPAGGAYASGTDGILRPSPGLTAFGDHLAPDSDPDGAPQGGQP